MRNFVMSPARAILAATVLVAVTTGCQRSATGRALRGPVNEEPSPTATHKVSRVEELLVGRPGVDVQRTSDGNYSVTIRGTGSFMSSEQPLYVIDGVPVVVQDGRGLSWINPADVTKIEILKNPTETTLYGVRGGNGVIVITTKRARSG